MRLNQEQLRFLAATEPQSVKGPILAKLDQIEKLLENLSDSTNEQAYDDRDVLVRLERIEKIISQVPDKKPATYVFDITRNVNGSLAKIVATPVKGSQ